MHKVHPKKEEALKQRTWTTSCYQKLIFTASAGTVSNHTSGGSSSSSLCRLPSSLVVLSRKTKDALVHLCLGRTILILANLPKKLQKSMFLPFNSFAHLFVPVRGWLVRQWLAWSDLISSTDVGFSQLPFFVDIAITFPPGRALVFCFVLLCFIFLFPFATLIYTVDCFFLFF